LYFEPLTLEDVLNIHDQEQCDGAIVQFGGQTPLNLAADLEANGVPIIGTSPRNIELAEDRKFFSALLEKLNLKQAPSGTATSKEGALEIAGRIGYPVLVRPSFVLGGRAMMIVYSDEELARYMESAVEASPERPVLVDRYLDGATEVDVDCISDGETQVVGAIMEHIEEAGIHSGDSACVIPSFSLSEDMQAEIMHAAKALARELEVRGLMNIQFAVKDNELFVIEVNPRASRTVPFVSKAIGRPMAKMAARVMVGVSLKEQGFTEEIIPPHYSVKEAVFPFVRFPGIDIILGPEMKSTGEVMGIDSDLGMAYAKSQMAASAPLPLEGNVFVSVKDRDKPALKELGTRLQELGFVIYATGGTARVIEEAGVPVNKLAKLAEGRPNVLDMIKNNDVQMLINSPADQETRDDEVVIRSSAVAHRIPVMTNMNAALASVRAIASLQKQELGVQPLQDYHPA
ncbi:MAG: carbamoyl-phosphate synthase large subunit, partial [Verrucomicrobiota bacterium]